MFNTTKTILDNNTRNLIKKIREAPILYSFFGFMIFFSIVTFAYGTYFSFYTEIDISIEEAFYSLFFIFMLKSSVDFYNNFIKPGFLSYALTTQIDQRDTINEIFLSVLVTQLLIWFSLSIPFLIILSFLGINVWYPVEYIFFTFGIIGATFLGAILSTHFFSSKKFRLMPTIVLLFFILYSKSYYYTVIIFPLIVIQYIWTLNHSIESYQYVNRKERTKERIQVKIRSQPMAFFFRETTVIWRDRLLFSFIITSVIAAVTSGYFYMYGEELILPESIRLRAQGFLPAMFMFLGIYVVVVYTSVFPTLILFLNEEKTMWILRNLPVSTDKIVFGKVTSLILCFITAIPYIAYIVIFIGIDNLFFITWLLIFSFIAGVILALPIGAKYVGKKSDLLLLYSISMILLVILGLITSFSYYIWENFDLAIILLMLLLIIEIGVLFFSIKLSSYVLKIEYQTR